MKVSWAGHFHAHHSDREQISSTSNRGSHLSLNKFCSLEPAPRAPVVDRQRLQISPAVEIAKRFRIAAVSLNMSETELFERLIELNFPSLHVQNLSKSPFFGAGQGGADDPAAQPVSVSIPHGPAAVVNRIGNIARKAALPVDLGIESHVEETDQS